MRGLHSGLDWPGCQEESESEGEAEGERTGVKTRTERAQQTEHNQGSVSRETETPPVESCQAKRQEHQLRLEIFSPGGGVPHHEVCLVRACDIELD